MPFRTAKQRELWLQLVSILLYRQCHCAYNSCRNNHQRPRKQKPHAKLLGAFSRPFRLFESLMLAPACVLKLQLKMTGVLPLPVSLSLCMCGHMVLPTNGVTYFVGWELKRLTLWRRWTLLRFKSGTFAGFKAYLHETSSLRGERDQRDQGSVIGWLSVKLLNC